MSRFSRLPIAAFTVLAHLAPLVPAAHAQDSPPTIEATPVAASAVESVDGPTLPAESLPGPAEAAAQFQRPATTHPWLRFPPAAWRRVVVTTHTIGPDGQPTASGVTTKDEILATTEGDRYVLRSRASVMALGREIEGEWVEASYSPLLESPGSLVSQARLPNESVVIDGRSVECQVWRLEYDDGGRRRSDVIWFSAEVFPHVLMRQRQTLADNQHDEPERVETTEVVAGSVPYLFGETVLTCACLRTTTEGPKGRSVTVEMVSPAAPGGQVVAWRTDWDVAGRPVQTVVAETIEFGSEAVDSEPATRRERRQQRRAARQMAE